MNFSMSADGIAISPSGFDPLICIHPVIEGSAQSKGKSSFFHGFLSKDQEHWFILRSVQDEGEGVARLHYVLDPKKNKNKKAKKIKKSKTR